MEKVLFTDDLSSNGLVKVFDALGVTLKGNIAIKIHSGEKGNQNYLKPEYVEELIKHVNGTIVEIIFLSLVVLLLLTLYFRYYKTSFYLTIPYFIWLLFATYLTFSIYLLN